AAHLFEIYDGSIEFVPSPTQAEPGRPTSRPLSVTAPTGQGLADIVAVYPTRSEFAHDMPPGQLFAGAKRLRLAGLSLNLLCQQYPDRKLVDLIESGTTVGALFLDPNGEHIRARGHEEGQPEPLLPTLTTVNIDTLRRTRTKLS